LVSFVSVLVKAITFENPKNKKESRKNENLVIKDLILFILIFRTQRKSDLLYKVLEKR